MSDETPRLKLPQLVSQQEMTNVTWNEALVKLDALDDLALLGQYVNDPPAAARDGDAYLTGGTPSGAWSGQAYKIASCLDGGWRFHTPFNGMRAYVVPSASLIVYLDGSWTAIGSADFATRSGSETLANKTLAGATLSGATAFPNGIIDAGGNVGIGTRNVSGPFQLTIASSTNPFVQFNGGAGLAGGFYYYNGTTSGSGLSFFAASDARAFAFLNNTLSNVHAPILVMQNQTVGIGDGIVPRSGASLDVGGAIFPHNDNLYNLGSANYRWATIYAGTGTINTSAANAKADIRKLTDRERAVAMALATNIRIFRYADAVTNKGDAARLHVGMVYEDVIALFEAHGLDPTRYGIVCRDPAMKRSEQRRSIQRQKCDTVVVPREVIRMVDGIATLSIIEEEQQVPIYQDLPLFDDYGEPVCDANGRPRRYRAPVLEEVEETFETEVPDVDDNGEPRWLLGLRYTELTQFIIAGLAESFAQR